MSDPTEHAGNDPATVLAATKAKGQGQSASDIMTTGSDIIPYVVPMFVYVGLTSLEGYLPQVLEKPSPTWYPIAYAAKLVIVALLAWYFRATWSDFRPWPGLVRIALGVLSGLLVCLAWVGSDGHYPALPFLLGSRSSFDPLALDPAARWSFIAVRVLGLVAVVPVIEELFWRSFMLRWIIDNDFLKVPVGRVTPMAAAVTSILFALAHPEWLPAVLTGALWAWLLWWTKSLSVCLISHATANLALAVYVITTHQWKFW